MAVATEPQRSRSKATLAEHIFAPRFWVGMNARGWFRLLARNGFRVHWQYWHVAAAVSCYSAINSTWGALQSLTYRRRLAQTRIDPPPIFVLGHWRSGTTLLHELMVLDSRHGFPTTYACLAPNHFLRTQPIVSRLVKIPAHRPMDNMAAGWDRPQEEEFALCNLGVPSPYLTIAFPNEPPQYPEYLTLEGLSDRQLEQWKRTLMSFLKTVQLNNPKRLVLKSPPHTARVKTLLEMFPDAKFVHIVRDPVAVFASTFNLWKTLYVKHGLQKPRYEGLDEYVFDSFERMYRKFEADRPLLRSGQLSEVRYEDLVQNPHDELRRIYEELELGGFDDLRPAVDAYVSTQSDYQTNRYPKITDEQRAGVARRWVPLMRRYEYE
ncbi:MAG TPA: sulfotransferase [Pirellulales bacterium]|jgi:hypothetical protein|nr:sulfotransferase [Pirellulales bacterium]